MTEPGWSIIEKRTVALVQEKPCYCPTPPFDPSEPYPEYRGPIGSEDNPAYRAIRKVLYLLGLDKDHFGTALWNPLGDLIFPGNTVVVKPNWVCHENLGKRAYGLTDTDSLITHGSIVRAVLEYVCLALKGRGKVILGDAPIQNTDWQALVRLTGAVEIIRQLRERFPGIQFELTDFRLERAIVRGNRIVGKQRSFVDHNYLEVDLASESLLEPLLVEKNCCFGVANYGINRMRQAHQPGRHIYLLRKETIEADVFINLPKIKTHLKAGITCALKNLVGTVGMKDYLPHFRLGSPSQGGDEYPDGNWLWHLRWWLAHKEWGLDSGLLKLLLWAAERACGLILRMLCGYPRDYFNLGGGGWFGNDTLWRTILDLNRVFFYYDRSAGKVTDTPVRSIRYLAIADGLIAGHKESPLSPTPVQMGIVLAAMNPVALDAVAAALMGFDVVKIPQIRESFCIQRYPLAKFLPEEIEIVGLDGIAGIRDIYHKGYFVRCEPSYGWKGHIEYQEG
jgi:uncharacterized protein (DUF362 family)